MAKEKLSYWMRKSWFNGGKNEKLISPRALWNTFIGGLSLDLGIYGCLSLYSPLLWRSWCYKRMYETPRRRNIKFSSCPIIFFLRLISGFYWNYMKKNHTNFHNENFPWPSCWFYQDQKHGIRRTNFTKEIGKLPFIFCYWYLFPSKQTLL